MVESGATLTGGVEILGGGCEVTFAWTAAFNRAAGRKRKSRLRERDVGCRGLRAAGAATGE